MGLPHHFLIPVVFCLYILSRPEQSGAVEFNQVHIIFFNILEENLNLAIVNEDFPVRTLVDCVQYCLSRGYCYSIYFNAQHKLCQLTNGSLERSLENVNGLVTYADYNTAGLRYFIRVGQRVTRGPTWDWGDEDGPGNLGTVTSFDNDIWWFVTWDHGANLNYRMGNGYQDLLVVG
ncbi:hypothetical protein CHS0354_006763 [Potamilus streckersoni]|uniref:MIB/HERC2 domain-containing protein n=1 Tax=Potamilus streckersoni TaxID=2493646 RepID=A0AAE0S807_9BIVA|nr:hypothetical protein CHS0354_006763 [Potamilus streckersoni]